MSLDIEKEVCVPIKIPKQPSWKQTLNFELQKLVNTLCHIPPLAKRQKTLFFENDALRHQVSKTLTCRSWTRRFITDPFGKKGKRHFSFFE
jgi:hypothetical protein